MKIISKVTSGFALFLYGQFILAQDNGGEIGIEKSYKSIIKIELAQGGLQFEQKNKKKNSLHFSLQYSYSSFFNKDDYDFQITPEYRFYLSNRRAWPYGFIRDVKHESGVSIIEESTHYLNFTGALSIGYTF